METIPRISREGFHPAKDPAPSRGIENSDVPRPTAERPWRRGDAGDLPTVRRRGSDRRGGPDHFRTLVNAAIAADDDRRAGNDTLLLAWRRRDVDTLNRFGRQRARAMGDLGDDEVMAARGGRCYSPGDPVVILRPDHQNRLVTSERGVVTAVDPQRQSVTVRTAERTVVLDGDAIGADRLDHAYATTIHRAQGATVDHAHVVAAGGGRQLGYVALSRARTRTTIYATADDLDQATEDLTRAWSTDDRRRWVLDQAPAAPEHEAMARRLDAVGRQPPARQQGLGR